MRVFYFLQEVIYSGASLSLLFFSQSLGGGEGSGRGWPLGLLKKSQSFYFLIDFNLVLHTMHHFRISLQSDCHGKLMFIRQHRMC